MAAQETDYAMIVEHGLWLESKGHHSRYEFCGDIYWVNDRTEEIEKPEEDEDDDD